MPAKHFSIGRAHEIRPSMDKATDSQFLQHTAVNTSDVEEAPEIVYETLNSSGQPLDEDTRHFMESRFGHDFTHVPVHAPQGKLTINHHDDIYEQEADYTAGRVLNNPQQRDDENEMPDFSHVRIHTDERAAQSARLVGAYAYTVGQDIVFGEGVYDPHSRAGQQILAHELTHTLQQSHGSPMIQRLSYKDIKESAYKGLINGIRKTKDGFLNGLRGLIGNLPPEYHGIANDLIGVIDFVMGLYIALLLAIIGILVGFGEGVAGLIEGLIKLGYGMLKLQYDFIKGIFTNFNDFKEDIQAIVKAVLNLPSALKALFDKWLDDFNKASMERQSLMISELTGQVLAIIATFMVTPSRLGSGAKIASETEAIVGGGARAGAAGGEAATQAARPALRVIEGGGQAAESAGTRVSAGAFEGGAARQLAPAIETTPRPVPKLVPPPEPIPVVIPKAASAATKPSTAAKVATGIGVAAAKAATVDNPDEEKKDVNRMSFQVQWNTRNGGPTFAEHETAPASTGVTTTQAITAIDRTVAKVRPKTAGDAALPAAEKQKRWIRNRPPAGVAKGGESRSEYFDYDNYRDARVDVVNQKGHNLKI